MSPHAYHVLRKKAEAMASTLSFSFLVHLGTFSCAFVVGFYAYPFLSPALTTHSLPRYGKLTLRTQLTIIPLPFLLLNLLLAALYVRSRAMLVQGEDEDAGLNMMIKELSTAAELPAIMKTSDDDDSVSTGTDFFYNASSGDITEVGQQQKRSAKNRPRRLPRSKSDGALLSLAAAPGKSPCQLRAITPLSKKARNFESAWRRRRRRRVKPVVVVADPPEDGLFAEEEVDKKAEEFIGRFYQKMRASRTL